MQDWQDATGWAVLAGAVVLVALVAVLAVALVRSRRATAAVVGEVAAHAADLQLRLDELERRVAGAAPAGARAHGPATPEFVITALGDPAADTEPPVGAAAGAERVGGALFADLVLRESVVKAASLAYGVRRALDPATRNRIRFEMRREMKRARKERRAEVRAARRVVRARGRAAVDPLDDAGTAA
jgi:type II secretory pathway component PulJ